MSDLRSNLYDKLWENINNKDLRVWTFLSFYGAALALFFGSNASIGIRLLGLPIMALLSVWTIQIVLDSEWWAVRNRMMVVRIETKCDEFRGLVPSYYQYPGYNSDSVTRLSLFVLSVIALFIFIYANIILQSLGQTVASGPKAATVDANLEMLLTRYRYELLFVFQLSAILAIRYFVRQREQQIDDCWKLAAHFQNLHLRETTIPPKEKTIPAVLTANGELNAGILKDLWGADRRRCSFRGAAMPFVAVIYAVNLACCPPGHTYWDRALFYLSLTLSMLGLMAFLSARYAYLGWVHEVPSIDSDLRPFEAKVLEKRKSLLVPTSLYYASSVLSFLITDFCLGSPDGSGP